MKRRDWANTQSLQQTHRSRGGVVRVAALLPAAAVILANGCATPLHPESDRDLRRSVRESARRELLEAERYPDARELVRTNRPLTLGISPEVMAELEKMAGPRSYPEIPALGPNIFGAEQQTATISLQQAIASTVENNLNVEFARLAPAISQAQVVAADAAFDWVLFANSQWAETDQPRVSSSINGIAAGVQGDQRQVIDSTVGVRKPLISGGQLSVQHQFTYTDNETDSLSTLPDPADESNIVVQLDQPLLRNFGSDTALAAVRLAKNTERDEVQNLKGQLITNTTDVEAAYWNLVRSVSDLQITQRLLERGEEVFDKISKRGLDVKQSDRADAASQVASRRADVRSAQKVLRDASDRLKVLMNDPRFPVGSEVLLLPVDTPVDQPVKFSLIDSLNTALANRPEVQRAVISVDNTAIRLQQADNARLPLLNLRALTRISALEGNVGSTYGEISDADYVDYQIRLDFEQPIGNRAAEAGYSVRRFERMQATVALRNTVQGVVSEVKSALRDVELNYALIDERRTARIAAAETVRTLLVEEQTVQALTPEFLDLKLRRQQALAAAEQQEIGAMVDYNVSLARLHQAMGITLERNKIQFDVPAYAPDKRVSRLFPDGDSVRPKRFEPRVPASAESGPSSPARP
jgi:outer membrane protein TolC